MNTPDTIPIPLRSVGPVQLRGPALEGAFQLPLATLESPLWPSVARGAKITRLAGGLSVVIIGECMTRSIAVEADSAAAAAKAAAALKERREDIADVIAGTSRFARLADAHTQQIGNVLFVRLSMTTGDAAGHNMATKAADAVMDWLTDAFDGLRYVSISGNVCTDKKNSAVNGILGRGRSAIADMIIPADICRTHLKAEPKAIADLNTRKNLLGSIAAGSVRSANAHYANMLLAFYLATGQDAANIVEGSQGMTFADLRGEDLYFSVTVPHLIVGTAGSGKGLDFARRNLETLDCLTEREPGENARRLAALAAAAVWCGELSLLAAQTRPGELMRAHESLERKK